MLVKIIGAGPVGITSARLLAEHGFLVHIYDIRPHIAGNCFDSYNERDILIHNYGPHYFRTNNDDLVRFLSQFTDFIPGNYVVKSQIKNEFYDFPINLNTINQFFNLDLNEKEAEKFINSIKLNLHPKNSEEFVKSRVGEKLFKAFYEGYTIKQWARPARKLDPSVCGRIPVRFNTFNKYVDHKHQLMPKNGFTEMFKKMLDHPNIQLTLNKKPKIDKTPTIYTGPIDEFFNYKYGKLEYRSLKFHYEHHDLPLIQPCVQINYPEIEKPWTRSVEFKHVTGQKSPKTTISYEIPSKEGEPYYPVPTKQNKEIYEKYFLETLKVKHVIFKGRLAEYVYINTDEAIERGIDAAKQMIEIVKSTDLDYKTGLGT